MAKIIGLLILTMLLRMINCAGLENNCTEFNPCKNMAECLRYDADPNRVKCVCQRGFNGNLCEIWPKICSEDFCFNGGTCVLIKRIPRCLCQPSYNGLFCERNSFQSNDVNNNYQLIGSPTSSTTSTTTVSYLTLHPSIYLTPNPNRMKQSICDFDPCLNFGQCLPITDRKSFFKFQCVCPDHYSGILCEKYSPPTSLPSTSFSSYTSSLRSSQSSLPNSFHFEQSTLKFLPDMSTHTYSYQNNPMEKSHSKFSLSSSSSSLSSEVAQTQTQTQTQTKSTTTTTPTVMTRTTSTETTKKPSTETNKRFEKTHHQQTKQTTSSSSSTTADNSLLESQAGDNNYQQRYSICAQLRPCANNGKCIDNENTLDGTPRFKCVCRPEFTGVFCHIKLNRRPNACVFNLCLNSGECIPNPEMNSFSCNCPANFTGKYCELNAY